MGLHKKFKVLPGLPPYGPMYVLISHTAGVPHFSEGYVVRFFKQDGTNWVGNFELGWTSLRGVYDLPDCKLVLVLAGGQAYLINPEVAKPVNMFGVNYRVALVTGDGHIILSCRNYVTIVNTEGEIWQSDWVFEGSLCQLDLTGSVLNGKIETYWSNGELEDFAFDVVTKELIEGKKFLFQFRETRTKPWWKFW